ncbi:MAG: glycosyltransferase family 39 protein [Acidobacteriota bacterium]|nr:MAG: glycosyltransferase family 39 protein [Acidobacteriota bacterium]
MPDADSTQPDRHLLLALAGVAFAFQIIPDLFGGYGYFIDELYYLACARRLDFGYVDHPPLAPFLLRIQTEIFGESIVSIRFLPALAGAVTVYLTGWLAAFFGGGRWAQTLAAITVLLAPAFLVMFDFFSMNGFELLFWTAAVTVMLVMVRRNEPKLWLVFGGVAGLGLLNKHTMVFIGFALVAGLLLSPARRLLLNRWLVFGGVVAFVLFLPNVLWQMENGWPSLEFYRNATLLKNIPSPPVKTLMNQIMFMNPVLFPIWSAGLVFLFTRDERNQVAGLAYVILLGILVLSQSSRPDRIAGLYPALFAAGAVWWERFFSRRAAPARWAFVGVVAAGGLALAPLFQPWLPPASVARFAAFVGIDTQMERGEGKRAELPQWLADRFGWEELVAQVAAVYQSLPPDEQRHTLIVAPSYGHAGALELLGRPFGLPPVVSGHNTYHLWGRELSGHLADGAVIVVGSNRDVLESLFDDVQQVGIYECEYCMNWRNDMPLYVARQSKLTASEFEEAWEGFKHYE